MGGQEAQSRPKAASKLVLSEVEGGGFTEDRSPSCTLRYALHSVPRYSGCSCFNQIEGCDLKMAKAWVYILRCADGSYYTGRTMDLEKRLTEHQSGEGSDWTRRRLPIELVFVQEMPDEDHAFLAEQQIKKWSRAKKEALIAGDWDMLRWLAKKPKFRK